MTHLLRVLLLVLVASPAWAQVSARYTLSANGSAQLDTTGMGTAAITVSGTYSGTVNFEVIGEPGTSAVTVDCATPAAPGTAVNSTTSTGVWTCPVAGLKAVQARMSSYVSGTAVVFLSAAPGGGGSGGGGSATASLTLQESDDGSIASGQTADAVVSLPQMYNGSAWVRLLGNATDGLTVNLGANNDVTVTGDALTALQLIDNAVSGAGFNITQLNGATIPMITTHASNIAYTQDALWVGAVLYCDSGTDVDLCPQATGGSGAVDANTTRVFISTDDDVSDMATLMEAMLVAHDAADAGSPVKVGAKGTTSVTGQTPVANNDRTDLYAGIDGILITRQHANLEDRVSAVVGVTDGSSTSLVAAQGAGTRFCATNFIVSNSSATNVTVDIRDGTAGSVVATIPAAANMGGASIPLGVPLCTTANTALAMDPSAAASTVTVTAVGFKTEL